MKLRFNLITILIGLVVLCFCVFYACKPQSENSEDKFSKDFAAISTDLRAKLNATQKNKICNGSPLIILAGNGERMGMSFYPNLDKI